MAKKEFRYRGKTLEELQAISITELAELLPAAARRKIKRGFTETEQTLMAKIQKKSTVKTHARDMLVLPMMVGKTVKIHNGKEYVQVELTDEMIGHYLGEFSQTRRNVKHGSAGIGSTKSSANAGKSTT